MSFMTIKPVGKTCWQQKAKIVYEVKSFWKIFNFVRSTWFSLHCIA